MKKGQGIIIDQTVQQTTLGNKSRGDKTQCAGSTQTWKSTQSI